MRPEPAPRGPWFRTGGFSLDQRIERARELARTRPSAAQLLGFFAKLLDVQRSLFTGFQTTLQPTAGGKALLSGTLDLPVLLLQYPLFLNFVRENGPAELAEFAQDLERAGRQRWEQLLSGYWKRDGEITATERFFALAYLQPYAEWAAGQVEPSEDRRGRPTCPVCDGEPAAGVLRPEGYGARRSLLCALCSTEWDYARIHCPACGETRFEQLAVFTSEEFEHIRVDACDSCRTYIKTVDLAKNGLAVPVVDELATVSLSLWAAEKGYNKLQPNLFGL